MGIYLDATCCHVCIVVLTYLVGYNVYRLALFVDLIVLTGIILSVGVGLLVFVILLAEMLVILLNL